MKNSETLGNSSVFQYLPLFLSSFRKLEIFLFFVKLNVREHQNDSKKLFWNLKKNFENEVMWDLIKMIEKIKNK